MGAAKIHHTGVFRTLEVLIVGFFFCKHETYPEKEEAFWDLINPEQDGWVDLEDVEIFLEKL